MNKKLMYLLIICGISLVLTGCNNTKNKPTLSSSPSAKEVKIDNISSAIGRGEKYICTYKDSSGVNSKIYIDNDKFKTEYQENNITQFSQFDGIYYYYWQSNNNSGYKIENTCLDDLVVGTKEETNSQNQSENEQEYNDEINSYQTTDDLSNSSEVSCQIVSTIDLSLPSNISFEDQCAILKAAKAALTQVENKINNIFDINE